MKVLPSDLIKKPDSSRSSYPNIKPSKSGSETRPTQESSCTSRDSGDPACDNRQELKTQ